MSDEMAKRAEEELKATPQATGGRSVSLTITLHPNQQIEFNLPLGNKILLYGLLEAARAQADKLYLIEETKRQSVSHGGIDGLLKRLNGG